MQYKAITLTQPYATLVALGAKRIETRRWQTAHRGTLLIHAAKGLAGGNEEDLFRLCNSAAHFYRALIGEYARSNFLESYYAPETQIVGTDYLPRGAIVAIAELSHIERITEQNSPEGPERSFGNYAPGRYAWHLSNVRRFIEPIPAKGKQGIWTWDGDLEACATISPAH